MNYHSDCWVMDRIREHYNDALEYFPEDRIVCLALAGSQNYGLDMEDSDVDTKLIVVPSFNDIAMNKSPVSTTHARPNNEHISFHDVRLYIPTLKKGNINFIETLFSKYTIVNPLYAHEWNRLVEAREAIARYDVVRAIHAMRGTMYNKKKSMLNVTEGRAESIKQFGYVPKEFYSLERTAEFITRYIDGELYADCLMSKRCKYLSLVKYGYYTGIDALRIAEERFNKTSELCDKFLETCDKTVNSAVGVLLNDVQYNIMKIAMEKELGK